ncbi:glycosyltransferase family 4 protein [Pararhodonellum marinum]|uniref:glycosyltransferase family 4 protein n=1 Tax=Pararhodonellum marinum TaxID=2755358 RepID=UPI00188FB47D|nr:glycosyltransferase family 4 protein [Pararhodonellum marinum]
MKKVVWMHTDLRSYWRGRLYFLKKYFEDQEIDFQVIEIFGKGSPYDFDTTVIHEEWWNCLFPEDDPKMLSNAVIRAKIFSTLDKLQPELLITGPIVFKSGALGLRWAKKRQKKIAFFDDTTHSSIKRNFLVSFVKKRFIEQADAYLLPTPWYDKEYTSLGIDRNRFFYGFNCVDNDFFVKKLEWDEKENWLICVARQVPVKNLSRLLKAWKLIESKNLGYSLVLVGDGFENESLLALAKALHLKDIQFLGKKNSDEIADLLHKSKAFILPSLSESWGLVINEAMATSLPILISKKANAAHNLVISGENGIHFDPYRVDEIANAISEFIALKDVQKIAWGKRSFELISEMNYNHMGSEVSRCLQTISKLPKVHTNPLAKLALSFWNGKYETRTWDYMT